MYCAGDGVPVRYRRTRRRAAMAADGACGCCEGVHVALIEKLFARLAEDARKEKKGDFYSFSTTRRRLVGSACRVDGSVVQFVS